MKTRCKFRVIEVTEHVPSPRYERDAETKKVEKVGETRRQTIKFGATYDPSLAEDRSFQKATPTGDISITIDNPVMLDAFKLGQDYYVDFAEVSS